MEEVSGFAARRAALRLIDAVLRRGETLDNAAHAACQGLSPPDRGLARALAGEVLRWLGDLDAMIDSATRSILPEDAKPRAVLRLMLAGWLRLETPPHAVIATGLPLLQGGPRRLAAQTARISPAGWCHRARRPADRHGHRAAGR